GRLRGDGRPADGRRLAAGRPRRGRRGRRAGEHVRLRGVGEEGLGGHAAGGVGLGREGGGGGLPGRALRRGAGREPAGGRRGAGLRPLPAAGRAAGRDPQGRKVEGTSRSTAARCCRSARCSGRRRRRRWRLPGHGTAWGPQVLRTRLDDAPVAPLKIASGCDRRCSFCAIPSFRGAFVSRSAEDILGEAAWLAEHGVRELFLVSENSTSYGKDLGDVRALETLIPQLAQVPGIDRVRVSYLQPAETRPGLVKVIATTPGVADYFDLSFQHSSEAVLRRMRRFGSTDSFLALIKQIRELSPEAGIRTNVIVGFPGETEDDLKELERFLTEGRLDAVGVFGYSDEDGTEALTLDGKLDADTVAERVARFSALVEELTNQRAEDRIGQQVVVLVEHEEDDDSDCVGRAAHQAPEVDGECVLVEADGLKVGDLVRAEVVDSEGVDLIVRPIEVLPR
ncbi:LOW QUALITY PROTEIN: MiaB tRNA modifying enzyme, partial [Kutzneria sp. 744]